MIKYIRGDLFSTTAGIIGHGCNCKGGFGAGIAAQIARRYPQVQQAYLQKFRTTGWRLGEVQEVAINERQSIFNCATQFNYGSPRGGKVYVDYPALHKVMEQLQQAAHISGRQVALPKIGAGLAGGDWTKIAEIINQVFQDKEVLVYEKD